jgi:hypothetical protein
VNFLIPFGVALLMVALYTWFHPGLRGPVDTTPVNTEPEPVRRRP